MSTALSNTGGSCSRDSGIKISAHVDLIQQSRLLFVMFADAMYIETLLYVTYVY